MAAEAAAPLDMDQVFAFTMKVFGDITAAEMGTLTTIGDRLGLFTYLAENGPCTVESFASGANINQRYAKEWLSAMACQGYITYDNGRGEFSMTPVQAFTLVDPDSPVYLTSVFAMVPAVWQNIDILTDAFRNGGGVPQDRFGAEFWCGFERFTRTAFRNNLVQDWIPAMPDIHDKLLSGGTAADVGCGNGQALLYLAQGYPNAQLTGYDSYAPAIDAANANAKAAGLDDRVHYEVLDVTKSIPGTYDLITSFDVVHDMPHPKPALSEIRKALKPDGAYFVLEFNLFGDLQSNIDHPFGIGSFGYAASTNYCMTQALAAGGVGTGTCMGEDGARELAAQAGFTRFRRLDFEHNPFNMFFEIRA